MFPKLSLFALLALATVPAHAGVISVWNFDGVCSDCPGHGTGVLTVSQAVANGPLSFEFVYSSAWIAYTMDNATAYFGNTVFTGTSFSIPTGIFRLQQTVPITSFGGVGNPLPTPGVYNDGLVSFFNRTTDNFWSTGSNAFVDDYGTGFTFLQGSVNSGVPEPSSVALLGAGVLAWALRRRQRGPKQ